MRNVTSAVRLAIFLGKFVAYFLLPHFRKSIISDQVLSQLSAVKAGSLLAPKDVAYFLPHSHYPLVKIKTISCFVRFSF